MKRTHEVMGSPNKTSPKSETNKRHGDQITGSPPKKKIKNGAPTPQPKNSVAMLNELRQGLIYTLEGQSGPVHAPIFTMSVEVIRSIFSDVVVGRYQWFNFELSQQVDGQKYNGQGRSKKIARIQAAQTALRSFIQFKDGAILSPSKPSNNVDFTSDEHLENGIIIKKEALLDSSKYYFSFLLFFFIFVSFNFKSTCGIRWLYFEFFLLLLSFRNEFIRKIISNFIFQKKEVTSPLLPH